MVLDILISIKEIRTIFKAAEYLQSVAEYAGYTSWIVIRSVPGDEGHVWERLAASRDLDGVLVSTRSEPVDLGSVFPAEVPTDIVADPRRPVRPNGVPGVVLKAELARGGVSVATAIPIPTQRGAASIVFLACGIGAATDYPTAEEQPMKVLRLAAFAVASAALDVLAPSSPQMTKSEKAVLEMIAAGMTPKEIATARSTSVRTVRNQMESGRKRIKAATIAHAVAIALSTGAIDVREGLSGGDSTQGSKLPKGPREEP